MPTYQYVWVCTVKLSTFNLLFSKYFHNLWQISIYMTEVRYLIRNSVLCFGFTKIVLGEWQLSFLGG